MGLLSNELWSVLIVAVGTSAYTVGLIVFGQTKRLFSRTRSPDVNFIILAQAVAGIYVFSSALISSGATLSCTFKVSTARIWFGVSRYLTSSAMTLRLRNINESPKVLLGLKIVSMVAGGSSTLVTMFRVGLTHSDAAVCNLVPNIVWFVVVVYIQPVLLLIAAVRYSILLDQAKEEMGSSRDDEWVIEVQNRRFSPWMMAVSSIVSACSIVVGVSSDSQLLLFAMVGDVCSSPALLAAGIPDDTEHEKKTIPLQHVPEDHAGDRSTRSSFQ